MFVKLKEKNIIRKKILKMLFNGKVGFDANEDVWRNYKEKKKQRRKKRKKKVIKKNKKDV